MKVHGQTPKDQTTMERVIVNRVRSAVRRIPACQEENCAEIVKTCFSWKGNMNNNYVGKIVLVHLRRQKTSGAKFHLVILFSVYYLGKHWYVVFMRHN